MTNFEGPKAETEFGLGKKIAGALDKTLGASMHCRSKGLKPRDEGWQTCIQEYRDNGRAYWDSE